MMLRSLATRLRNTHTFGVYGKQGYLTRYASSATATSGKVLSVEDLSEFEKLAKSKTLFVDFYADWCGPCRMISPKFNELANEHTSDTVSFVKVNVDKATDIAIQQNISSIPAFKTFKNGKVVAQMVGADPNALKNMIKSNK